MAVLSNADRADIASDVQQKLSALRTAFTGLRKGEFRAMVNAADDWANSNAAEYNTALPQPGRGILSASDKALLLMLVIAKRHLRGV